MDKEKDRERKRNNKLTKERTEPEGRKGKRSRSEERERIRKYRESRTAEEIVDDREKDRERKGRQAVKEQKGANYDEREANRQRIARIRAMQTDEEKKAECEALKARMLAVRARQTTEEKELEKEKAKEGMTILRENKTSEEEEIELKNNRERIESLRKTRNEEDIDYDKIIDRQRRQKQRNIQTGKEHLLGNLEAKKGMRVLRQYGRLTTFSHRDSISRGKEDDDLSEWKKYFDKSQYHSEKLMQNQPDIVTRLNAKSRLEKEKEIQRKEKEKETANHGEWHYNGEMDEYEWTGENEPEYYQEPLNNEALTDAEKLISKEAEERWMNAAIEERKQQRREKRQKKDKERKEAMEKPVNPLPARELCQYEKIREGIIKERQEAMAKCNFFENLLESKKEMGFYGKTGETKVSKSGDESEKLK